MFERFFAYFYSRHFMPLLLLCASHSISLFLPYLLPLACLPSPLIRCWRNNQRALFSAYYLSLPAYSLYSFVWEEGLCWLSVSQQTHEKCLSKFCERFIGKRAHAFSPPMGTSVNTIVGRLCFCAWQGCGACSGQHSTAHIFQAAGFVTVGHTFNAMSPFPSYLP